MSSALAIVGGGVGGALRVEPGVSEPANTPMDPTAMAALKLLAEMRDLLAKQAAPVAPRSPSSILTVAEAVEELRMGDTEGREFLAKHNLVHHVGRARRGSGRVIMSDLLDAIRGKPASPRAAPTVLPLPKTTKF